MQRADDRFRPAPDDVVADCRRRLGIDGPYLLVVGVRRSGFGSRLLALKDSPAACATLGLDVTRLKLAVFALSALPSLGLVIVTR